MRSFSDTFDDFDLGDTLSHGPPASSRRAQAEPPRTIAVWQGASGQSYGFLAYRLVTCPPVADACYLLVRTTEDGQREVLHVGLTSEPHSALNLAEIRHLGAMLGADEVHVRPCPKLRDARQQREQLMSDLQLGLAFRPAARQLH